MKFEHPIIDSQNRKQAKGSSFQIDDSRELDQEVRQPGQEPVPTQGVGIQGGGSTHCAAMPVPISNFLGVSEQKQRHNGFNKRL